MGGDPLPSRQVPDDELAVKAHAGQPSAAREERDRRHGLLVAPKSQTLVFVLQVPEPDGMVVSSRGEKLSVRRESKGPRFTLVSFEYTLSWRAFLKIPDPDPWIFAAQDEGTPFRAEGEIAHKAVVRQVRSLGDPCGQVPHHHTLVPPASGEGLAVRRQPHGMKRDLAGGQETPDRRSCESLRPENAFAFTTHQRLVIKAKGKKLDRPILLF